MVIIPKKARRNPNILSISCCLLVLFGQVLGQGFGQDCSLVDSLETTDTEEKFILYYTGSRLQPLVITPNPFKTSIVGCESEITYTCFQKVPNLSIFDVEDICTYLSATGKSTFDASAGVLTFESEVYDELIYSYYNLQITGVINGIQATQSVIFEIKHPCTKPHTVNLPSPFPTSLTHYISDAAVVIEWDYDMLINQDTAGVDCGDIQLSFFQKTGSSGKEALDPKIFKDDRTTTPFQLTIRKVPQDDENLDLDDYQVLLFLTKDISFFFQADLVDWNDDGVTSEDYSVYIRDFCTENRVIESFKTAQIYEYINTDSPLYLNIPELVYSPPECFLSRLVELNIVPDAIKVEIDPATGQVDMTIHNELSVEKKTGVVILTLYDRGTRLENSSLTIFVQIKFLNPCTDPNFVNISCTSFAKDYILGSSDQDYTYGGCQAVTEPIQHELCGDFDYVATNAVDGSSVPISGSNSAQVVEFDPLSQIFDVYSEDLSLTEPSSITVTGAFSEYPTVSSSGSVYIQIVNPCTDPNLASISQAETQLVQLDDYLYDGSTVKYEVDPAQIQPDICQQLLTYSCSFKKSSPRADLCTSADNLPFVASFDDQNGIYTFSTTNKQEVPIGTYEFDITAIIGNGPISSKSSFTLTIYDQCLSKSLTLVQPQPLQDQAYFYLSLESISQDYQVLSMVEPFEAQQECGPLMISFRDESLGGQALNPDLFDSGVPIESEQDVNKFTVLATDDAQYVDSVIEVVYTISLTDYPSISIQNSFTVSFLILNACDDAIIDQGILLSKPGYCPKPIVIKPFIGNYGRPVIEPEWFTDIEGMRVKYNEGEEGEREDLRYGLGDPVNVYGEQMTVKVDFGNLSDAVSFNESSNMILVDQSELKFSDTGYQRLKIEASYIDTDDQIITFKKTIYLRIVRPVLQDDPWFDESGNQEPDLIDDGKSKYSPLEVLTAEEILQRSQVKTGPIPYIKSLSFRGELTIGWSEAIQVYGQSKTLPQQKIVLEYDRYSTIRDNEGTDQQRMLAEVIDKYEIKDAVDITVQEETDKGMQVYKVDWDVKKFTQEEIVLQIYLNSDHKTNQGNEQYLIVKFWDPKYFKSLSTGVQTSLGVEISQRIYRQYVQDESTNFVSLLTILATWLFYILVILSVLLVLSCGSLAPTLMAFDSIQLIAYMPLVLTNLPTNANMFIFESLSIFRIHSNNDLRQSLAEWIDSGDFKENFSSQSSYFSAMLDAYGYGNSLLGNTSLLCIIIVTSLLLWLLVSILTVGRNFFFSPKNGIRNRSRNRSHQQHEAICNGIVLRLLLQLSFEVMLCLMISFKQGDQIQEGWSIEKALQIVFTVIYCGLFILMCLLCYSTGPYIEDSYQPGFFWRSLVSWTYRPVKQEYLDLVKAIAIYDEEDGQTSGSKSDNPKLVKIDEANPESEESLGPNHLRTIHNEQNIPLNNIPLTLGRNIAIARQIGTLASTNKLGGVRSGTIDHFDSEVAAANDYQTPPQLKENCRNLDIELINTQGPLINGRLTAGQTENFEEFLKEPGHEFSVTQPVPFRQPSSSQSIQSRLIKSSMNRRANTEKQGILLIRREDGPLGQSPVTTSKMNDAQPESSDGDDLMKEGGEQQDDCNNLNIPLTSDNLQSEMLVFPSITDNAQQVQSHEHTDLTRLEARTKVYLVEQVQVSARVKYLYVGLERNHPHNMTSVHPILYIGRRAIYCLLLVYLNDQPILVIVALIAISIVVFAYVANERPWQHSLINQQQRINEIGLYTCLVLMSYTAKVSMSQTEADIIGLSLISIILCLYLYNITIVTIFTAYQLRLVYRKCSNKTKVQLGDYNKKRRLSIKVQPETEVIAPPSPTKRELLRYHDADTIELDQIGEDVFGIQIESPEIKQDESEKNLTIEEEIEQYKQLVDEVEEIIQEESPPRSNILLNQDLLPLAASNDNSNVVSEQSKKDFESQKEMTSLVVMEGDQQKVLSVHDDEQKSSSVVINNKSFPTIDENFSDSEHKTANLEKINNSLSSMQADEEIPEERAALEESGLFDHAVADLDEKLTYRLKEEESLESLQAQSIEVESVTNDEGGVGGVSYLDDQLKFQQEVKFQSASKEQINLEPEPENITDNKVTPFSGHTLRNLTSVKNSDSVAPQFSNAKELQKSAKWIVSPKTQLNAMLRPKQRSVVVSSIARSDCPSEADSFAGSIRNLRNGISRAIKRDQSIASSELGSIEERRNRSMDANLQEKVTFDKTVLKPRKSMSCHQSEERLIERQLTVKKVTESQDPMLSIPKQVQRKAKFVKKQTLVVSERRVSEATSRLSSVLAASGMLQTNRGQGGGGKIRNNQTTKRLMDTLKNNNNGGGSIDNITGVGKKNKKTAKK